MAGYMITLHGKHKPELKFTFLHGSSLPPYEGDRFQSLCGDYSCQFLCWLLHHLSYVSLFYFYVYPSITTNLISHAVCFGVCDFGVVNEASHFQRTRFEVRNSSLSLFIRLPLISESVVNDFTVVKMHANVQFPNIMPVD